MTTTGPQVSANGTPNPSAVVAPPDAVLDRTLGLEDEPLVVLTSLYESNSPGWRLKVIEPIAPSGGIFGWRHRLAPGQEAKPFTADSLSTLLYRAGFVDTRVEIDQSTVTATAVRGELQPPTDRPLRLSVVMPVYNERETFRTVFEELLAVSIADTEIEIVVVESNSTDGTREDVLALRDIPRVTVILENKPSGKGHAVRAGLRRASGDVILIQDADSEYDMADYEKLLEPLRSFESSFVLGSRSCNDGRWGLRRFQQKQHLGSLLNLGHVAFLTLFNATYGQRLSDPFTMYKVFRRDCLTDVQLECNRFDFDWELTAKLIRRGHVPRELPVRYHSRSFAEGKKITLLRDPMTWVRACFKYRFAPIYPVVYPANSVNLRDATPMSLEAVDLETRNPDSTQVTASEVAGAGRWSAHKSPLTSRNGARRLGRPFKNPVS